MLQTQDVFNSTSANVPQETFVDRGEVGVRLDRSLIVKGKPICLVGPYRSGKTSLVLKQISRRFAKTVHILCQPDLTYEKILIDSFQDLSEHYSNTETVQVKKSPGLMADFVFIKAQLGGTEITEKSKGGLRIPSQLTSRSLAKFMAAADAVWLIDDLHKLPEAELIRLAGAVREWQTLSIDVGNPKVVLIGSDQNSTPISDKLFHAIPDLKQRLVTLALPRMSDEELHEIISKGGKALNVDFSEIADTIVTYSYGYPGICHDLCFHTLICADITHKSAKKVGLTTEQLKAGVDEYVEVSTGYVRAEFEKITSIPIEGASGFSNVVFSKIQSLAGENLSRVSRELSAIFALSEEAVAAALERITSDDESVLYIDKEQNIIRFREPVFWLYHQRGANKLGADVEKRRAADILDKIFAPIRHGGGAL